MTFLSLAVVCIFSFGLHPITGNVVFKAEDKEGKDRDDPTDCSSHLRAAIQLLIELPAPTKFLEGRSGEGTGELVAGAGTQTAPISSQAWHLP